MSYNPKLLKLRKLRKRAKQQRYTHVDRAYYHREKSESVALVLRQTVLASRSELDPEQFDELMALTKRMEFCSERANHYLADDMHSEQTGETFAGFGHLFPCSSKLCHACAANYGKRNHKTAAAAINEVKLVRRTYKDYETGKTREQQELLRFITLTMPPIVAGNLETLKILADAWERFRKTDFFKNYVSGFARDAEFTTRKDGTYHAHIHLIAASVFIPEDLIKKFWTKCVEAAFEKAGLEFRAETASGYCVVNLELAGDVESATRELCKYITKSDSWSEVPKAHLLEMASVARWPKMFSLGGTFAAAALRLERQRAAARAAAKAMSSDSAHAAMDAERESYLDTKSLSGGFSSEETSGEPPTETEAEAAAEAKRRKKPNWRKLVRKIGLDRYLIILEAQVSAQRLYRKIQLREKYPLATFKDLTGRTWAQPRTEFVEEYDEATGETMRWNAPEFEAAEIYDEEYYESF
jgi:hypothetical protein